MQKDDLYDTVTVNGMTFRDDTTNPVYDSVNIAVNFSAKTKAITLSPAVEILLNERLLKELREASEKPNFDITDWNQKHSIWRERILREMWHEAHTVKSFRQDLKELLNKERQDLLVLIEAEKRISIIFDKEPSKMTREALCIYFKNYATYVLFLQHNAVDTVYLFLSILQSYKEYDLVKQQLITLMTDIIRKVIPEEREQLAELFRILAPF